MGFSTKVRTMFVSPKVLLLSLVFAVGSVATPATPAAAQQPSQTRVNDCELNVHLLDTAHHLAGDDTIIIAIAHLGAGEVNRELNRRRLHNVRAYLTYFGWKRPRATVVTAEGEKVDGVGRVDIYVRGLLWASLGVRRNGDLILGICEPDYMRSIDETRTFYPFRDRKKKR